MTVETRVWGPHGCIKQLHSLYQRWDEFPRVLSDDCVGVAKAFSYLLIVVVLRIGGQVYLFVLGIAKSAAVQ